MKEPVGGSIGMRMKSCSGFRIRSSQAIQICVSTFVLMLLAAAECERRCIADTPAGSHPTGKLELAPASVRRAWVIPNGRIIQPVGALTMVDNFPLGITSTPDGRRLLVVSSGAGKQSISILDGGTMQVMHSEPVKSVFHGAAVSRDGAKVWVCGGGANNIQVFSLRAGKLAPAGVIPVPGYPASCRISADGSKLYVTCNLAGLVRVLDVRTDKIIGEIQTGIFPFGIALTPDGAKGYVSNWSDGTVSVLDLKESRPVATLQAGGLPCGIVCSPDGKHVYVANANTDELTVIDATKDVVERTVGLHPYPKAPHGAAPNGIQVSPDGTRLFVTMAGINAVDVLSLPECRVIRQIPTAWYPTGIFASNSSLYVVNSKGAGSGPNKHGGDIGTMMHGAVQKIDLNSQVPASGIQDVARLNGYADRLKGVFAKTAPIVNRLSSIVGLPSGIKHVVFIVRENRSYDQVLGDLGYANGDPTLTIFGERITPNLHALARRFAIADNMYGDGEVSVQGHQWTLGANCPDYVEKTWQAYYSRRGRFGDIIPGPASYPAFGYMMDHCVRKNVSCRMYGDFVRRERGGRPVAELADKVCVAYTGWNLNVPDQERAAAWLEDFRAGNFPRFSYIWLPNDHTAATKPGMLTPRAMVADNDLATGRVFEAISHHPEWKDTVIFLTEDDTQDGRDHVDAHRNILLIASPWVKPGSVATRHYSFGNIYATMERFLGLPPLSQYDDLADPISGIWADKPDTRPYTSIAARVPLGEKNLQTAAMAKESKTLDLEEPDANTGPLLERILWASAKGADRPKRVTK